MDSKQRVRAAALFVDELTFKVATGCYVDSDRVEWTEYYNDAGAI